MRILGFTQIVVHQRQLQKAKEKTWARAKIRDGTNLVYILVTGSSGRIGTPLCKALIAAGHFVIPFDVKDNINLDIRTSGALSQLLPVDLIIHLAAMTSVKACQDEPGLAVDINISGTRNVFQEAIRSYTPAVLLVSSCDVYGEPTTLPRPVHEATPVRPISVYGRCKAICEDLALDARRHNVATSIIRLPTVYGDPERCPGPVETFAKAAAYGGDIHLFDGHRVFDFLHLDDAVSGLVRAASALLEGQRHLLPIHLATGIGTPLGDIAQWAHQIAATSGRVAKISQGRAETYEVADFYGSPQRALKFLRWRAQISVEAGFRKMVADLPPKSFP